MTTTLVRPKSQVLQAWQYGSSAKAPEWVAATVKRIDGDLLVDRTTGLQLVSLTDWLLKDPDERDLLWCTNADYVRDYEAC